MRSIVLGLLLAFSLATRGAEPATPSTFRVMTYNIHHAQGLDGKVDVERIAKVINTQKVDLVALQEVDRSTLRTDRRDLPAELAKLTGMYSYFERNIDYQGGEYGNAILSRFPLLHGTNVHYQMLKPHEQRGLLQVVLEVHGRKLLFMNTHLDYHNDDAERATDVSTIKAAMDAQPGLAVVLCGDFNGRPGSGIYTRLQGFLSDTWKTVGKGPGFTFSSSAPWQRIDFIWHSKGLRPLHASVPETTGSDHLPVVAEFALE